MIYLDTSALIKRYIWELGSEHIHRVFSANDHIGTSKITYAEVYAALTRRKREGHLSQVRYSRVCRFFEREWPAYLITELHEEVLRLTRDLIKKYPLRAYDAVHLASAKFLKGYLKTPITFVCADQRLFQCAKAEGFQWLAMGD